MTIELHLGDCLEVMRTMPDNSVDTILTDPPYGLTFMGKDWDRGVPGVAFWEQALRVAKPGAMLLAMGGTRTFHRLVCAIEDAGWEVRDSMAWLYGSGFPKSYNISKGIDKRGGKSVGWFGEWLRSWREENGITQKEIAALFPSKTGGLTGCVANWELGFNMPTAEQFSKIVTAFDLPFETIEEAEREVVGKGEAGFLEKNNVFELNNDGYGNFNITAPATPAAQLWHGWGTALKPAMELICVAMKPIDGTFVNNALTWGVAGLWIDGGRVGSEGGGTHCNNRDANGKCLGHPDRTGTAFGLTYHAGEGNGNQGRFPANVIHDGSDEVTGLFPQSKTGDKSRGREFKGWKSQGELKPLGKPYNGGDSGSAARFFYCAKASRSERNAGLEGMDTGRVGMNFGGALSGHGKPINIKPHTNSHPTVKPLALMRYLARLTKTPTGGVVLDPFMGSGTTGVACVQTGRNFIGIEIDPDYFAIAERRIKESQWHLPLFEKGEK